MTDRAAPTLHDDVAGDPASDDAGEDVDRDPGIYNRRWKILAVLCLSLLVVGIDGTIVNVALPTFVRELGASQTELQWITDAYTIVFASMLLTAGALGDRFGRRGALLVGLAIFGVGSAASAFAGSPEVLIATRAVQGLGSAFIMPSTLSILTNVFPAEERGRAIGIWAGISGVGVGVGPVTGGWLLEHFWWGSIFLVNIPVIALAVAGVLAIVPTSVNRRQPRIDIVGTVLSITGLTALLYGVIEAPRQGWTDPATLAGFIAGGILLAGFVVWELRSDHPMLNMRYFRNPRFSAASVAITLVFFALFGIMFLLSQYLQFVLGYSALESGAALLPVAGALAVSAPLSASLVSRFGTKVVVAGGLLLVSVAFAVLSQAETDSGFELVALALVIGGMGMGLTMAPATDSILGAVPADEAGVGSAVNDTTREVGGALGIAVLGSITTSAYTSRIGDSSALRELASAGGAQGAQALDAVSSSVGNATEVASRIAPLERAGTVPAGTGQSIVDAANNAFVDAMDPTVIVGAIVVLLGALIALVFLPARPERADTGDEPEVDDLASVAARQLSQDRFTGTDTTTAALYVISQVGLSSLSFNGIAARSGISGTADAQWDANLGRVVAAAREALAEQELPDTGQLRGDLRAYLEQTAAMLRRPEARPVLVALLDATVEQPETAETLHHVLVEPRHRALRSLVVRARERGEVDPDVDVDLLGESLVGPLYLRVLVGGGPLDDDMVDRLVDTVVRSAAPGGRETRPV